MIWIRKISRIAPRRSSSMVGRYRTRDRPGSARDQHKSPRSPRSYDRGRSARPSPAMRVSVDRTRETPARSRSEHRELAQRDVDLYHRSIRSKTDRREAKNVSAWDPAVTVLRHLSLGRELRRFVRLRLPHRDTTLGAGRSCGSARATPDSGARCRLPPTDTTRQHRPE